MRMLKAKEIDAFVSAGNTGALVGSAKMTLGMLPGLNHPALLALMPTKLNPLAVLDVGANLECKAEHLVQLALIGSAYQKARGITLPSIGLLNIGSEAIKGTIELRSAYQKLEQLARQKDPFFKFSGNVEGKTVFDGTIDVLITDGFTGNVFLKTAEGIASLILDRLHEHLSKDSLEQLKGQLSDLQSHLHYAEYPGALLCGVAGIVIKCHGYSSPQAFTNAIREANRVVSENFFQILQKKLLRDCKTIN
jgi:glycerol-3-phosphate acyltransferase PlsX